MKYLFCKFIDFDEFEHYLNESDLIMCKRNFISPYWEYFGLLSPEGHLEAACVIQKLESNKLFIKLFEVSEKNYRQGLGTKLFTEIFQYYREYYRLIEFDLESLDDESTAFWEHLGFKPFENEDGDTLYKLTIC